MSKILGFLFNRITIIVLLMLVQAAALAVSIWGLSHYFVYIYIALFVLSALTVLWIINTWINPAYKLAWTILILSLPIFGGLFYLCFGANQINKSLAVRLKRQYDKIAPLLRPDEGTDRRNMSALQEQSVDAANQSRFIRQSSGYPLYQNTQTLFLSPGENKFEKLIKELQKAERFIFLEYFIIHKGLMWNTILEILKQKAAQGVDVRVMYDGCGSLMLLPADYPKKLESMGIKCQVFNPLRPMLSVTMNNRDHRKIFVIDGHTAFTGGINLSDEYINVVDKYGHWKDASIMIRGEAVWSFTLMFLGMWNYKERSDEDFEQFRPPHNIAFQTDGFVQPYGDSPLDYDDVGEMVYLNMINRAKKYVYISTPYLIVDNELVTALILAAESGVDVRIVTPHVWDKWYVHMVSSSYYRNLIERGVKIYEYTPGFIHSKTFVVDDEIATVGTINMDYRSLYLHFECGVWMYRSAAVGQVYRDYMEILKASQRVTLEECRKVRWYQRMFRGILRAFAPLM